MADQLTFGDLLSVLRRRRKVIIWTVAACVSLAVLVCIVSTRLYGAVSVVQISNQETSDLGLQDMSHNPDNSADALEATIALQTQVKVLQSETLAIRVIKELNLEHTPGFRPHFNPIGWVLGLVTPKGPHDPANASLENSPARLASVVATFEKRLKVTPEAGTKLVKVRYMDPDPKLAATVVNHLTRGLVDYNFETRYTATSEASTWLASQLDELKHNAETLQAKVVQLQRESGVYSLGTSDSSGKEMAYSANLDQLQQTTQALTAATENRILKQSIYETAKTSNPDAISNIGASSMTGASSSVNNTVTLLQTLRAQQAQVASQYALDSSKYGSANPKLDDERAQLESLNASVQKEIKRLHDLTANDYHEALIEEQALKNTYNSDRAVASKLNDRAIEYSIAKQEADRSRELYETLYQHLKEAGVMEGLHASNITIVDSGRIPDKPSSPNVLLYLAGSLFVGFIFGILAALLVDSLDDSVQSLERLEHSLHTPVMGIIPTARITGGSRLRLNSGSSRSLTRSGADGGNRISVVADPGSAFAEALRSLRTALLLSRGGSPPKIILVTSPAQAEGKSMLSLNLAASLAQAGDKVLLIDADLRRPSLSKSFSELHGAGLSEILADESHPLEFAHTPELPTLSLLTAGPRPPFPSELLSSASMRRLINKCAAHFDFIVIDSPPVLAVTDPLVLSRLADSTLLIGRHGRSKRKALERAYRMLQMNDKHGISIVLNDLHHKSASYAEYHGYDGSDYYTPVEEKIHA